MSFRHLTLAILMAALLAGCEWQPNVVPRLAPDGRRAAWLLPGTDKGEKGKAVEVVVADVRKGTTVRHRVPPGASVWGFAWHDDRLLLRFDPEDPLAAPAPQESDSPAYGAPLFWWMDIESGRLTRDEARDDLALFTNAATGLSTPDLEILTSPALPKLLARGLSPNLMFPAGQGGLAVMRLPNADSDAWEALAAHGPFDDDSFKGEPYLLAVDLYDQKARLLGTLLTSTRGGKAGIFPGVRLSPDLERVLVLHDSDLGDDKPDRFSCHEVATGDILWSAIANWDLNGIPAFDGESMVLVEATASGTEASVNRLDGQEVETLMTIPFLPRADGEDPTVLYSPDDKARRLVVQVLDGDPRTLLIPLDKGPLDEEDVTELRW